MEAIRAASRLFQVEKLPESEYVAILLDAGYTASEVQVVKDMDEAKRSGFWEDFTTGSYAQLIKDAAILVCTVARAKKRAHAMSLNEEMEFFLAMGVPRTSIMVGKDMDPSVRAQFEAKLGARVTDTTCVLNNVHAGWHLAAFHEWLGNHEVWIKAAAGDDIKK